MSPSVDAISSRLRLMSAINPKLSAFAIAVAAGAALLLTVTAPAQSQTSSTVTNSIPITFSGEVRARSEWDHPGGTLQSDEFTYLRTRFGVRVDATPKIGLMIQVQDSRVLGGEANPLSTSTSTFELHQAFLELATPWRSAQGALRVGRQEISVTNERLIGASNWTNTGRSFDGVRLLLSPTGSTAGAEGWTLSLFGATVEEHGRHFGTTGDENGTIKEPDHSVIGAFGTRQITTARAGKFALEGTAFHDAGSSYRSYKSANRTTVDGRVRMLNWKGVRADVEGALQFGRQRFVGDTAHVMLQDVKASLFGARVGIADKADSRIGATIGADRLSGDVTPGDGQYGAFNTLFASNHQYYGLQDVIGEPAASTKERGLVDAFAMGTAKISPNISIKTELHHFTLATGTNTNLGWEADFTLPVKLGSAATFDFGYSAFHPDVGAQSVGLGVNGSMKHWVFVQLRAGF